MAARRQQYYDYSPNYYNNSSSALEALPIEEVVRVSKKKPKTRSKNRGTKIITEDATDKSARPSLLIGVVMLLIAAGAFLSILVNSYAVVQNMENNQLRSELQTMQMRTTELATLAATSIDMEEVELIARTRLGMGEPQIHQIRHIYVPWQNYVPSLPGLYYANEPAAYSYYLAEASVLSGSFFSELVRMYRELVSR